MTHNAVRIPVDKNHLISISDYEDRLEVALYKLTGTRDKMLEFTIMGDPVLVEDAYDLTEILLMVQDSDYSEFEEAEEQDFLIEFEPEPKLKLVVDNETE